MTALKPEYLNPDLMFLSPVSAFLFYSVYVCVHTHACVYVRVSGYVCGGVGGCVCVYVCQGMLVNIRGQIVESVLSVSIMDPRNQIQAWYQASFLNKSSQWLQSSS